MGNIALWRFAECIVLAHFRDEYRFGSPRFWRGAEIGAGQIGANIAASGVGPNRCRRGILPTDYGVIKFGPYADRENNEFVSVPLVW